MEPVLVPAASEPTFLVAKEMLQPTAEPSADDKSFIRQDLSELALEDQQDQDEPLTIIIEHCKHCSSHGWNTRHNEAKYLEVA